MDVVYVRKETSGTGVSSTPSKLLDKNSFNGVLASLFAGGFECVESRYLVGQIVARGYGSYQGTRGLMSFGVDWVGNHSFTAFLRANLDSQKYEYVKRQGRIRVYEKVRKSGQKRKQ